MGSFVAGSSCGVKGRALPDGGRAATLPQAPPSQERPVKDVRPRTAALCPGHAAGLRLGIAEDRDGPSGRAREGVTGCQAAAKGNPRKDALEARRPCAVSCSLQPALPMPGQGIRSRVRCGPVAFHHRRSSRPPVFGAWAAVGIRLAAGGLEAGCPCALRIVEPWRRDMSFWNTCILAYCRLGIAGLSPKAPGTAGSALAALLAPLIFLPLPLWGRLLFLAVIVVTGGLAATRAEILLGRTDPGEVVIDELAGVWIALLPLGAGQWSWAGLVWAFALFRLFDIWKPWPVHASENWLPAGWGIMLDDILAGLMAMCCMLVLRALGWV